jgi:hypothetical protein
MRAVKDTPREQRLAEGSRRLNPDALREQGVPLPRKVRISSRYFDEDYPKGVEFGDPQLRPSLHRELGLLPGVQQDAPTTR